MNIAIYDALRITPFFHALTADQLTELARNCRMFTFPENTELHTQGEQAADLFVVLSGQVELDTIEEDGMSTVSVVGEGRVFPLEAVITDEPTLVASRTVGRTKLVAVPAAPIRALLEASPAFCRSTLQLVARISRGRLKKLNSLKLRTSTERLALWLLENLSDDGRVEITFELRTLAAVIGTTPENLSRSFSLLEPVLKKRAFKKFEVSDLEGLKRIARPTPMLLVN